MRWTASSVKRLNGSEMHMSTGGDVASRPSSVKEYRFAGGIKFR